MDAQLNVQRVYLIVNDMSMLFSVVNSLGDLYVMSYADYTEDSQLYLMLRVSPERLGQLERGELDIRGAFLNSETGSVLLAEFSDENGNSQSFASLTHFPPDSPELTQWLAEPGTMLPE